MPKTKKIQRNTILIKNYGLFWKTDDVFWGKPKVLGNLLGIRDEAKRSDFVNFREQIGIYVLYADYRIVYIGQAGNGNAKLFDRLKNHFRGDLSGRWNQFSWFGLKWALKSGEHKLSGDIDSLHPEINLLLNHIEAILIFASEPPLNRQGGRWGKTVERYHRYRDENNLGKTQIELLRETHSDKNFSK